MYSSGLGKSTIANSKFQTLVAAFENVIVDLETHLWFIYFSLYFDIDDHAIHYGNTIASNT